METMQTRIFGLAGATLATVTLLAALHGYAAGIQRNAPREVVEMERVVVTAHLSRHAAADPAPHVGEI